MVEETEKRGAHANLEPRVPLLPNIYIPCGSGPDSPLGTGKDLACWNLAS